MSHLDCAVLFAWGLVTVAPLVGISIGNRHVRRRVLR